jgi:hypothetical protein
MNIHEGARRMTRAGQWMVFLPPTTVILLCVVGWMSYKSLQGLGGLGVLAAPGLVLTPFCVPLMIIGGSLCLAAWITEGFAKEPD